MKRIILLTIALIFTYILTAQKPVKFGGSVEVGYKEVAVGLYDNWGRLGTVYGPFYSDIKVNTTLYNILKIETGIENSFTKDEGDFYTFRPLQTTYTVDINIKLNKLTIGYGHMCSHPVWNDITDIFAVKYRASYDKIYIKHTF